MKSFVYMILVMAALNASAQAAGNEIIKDTKATLKICDRMMMGCANSIVVNGKGFIISYDQVADVDKSNSTLLNTLLQTCQAKKKKTTAEFYVEGYIAKEKGHFPNPMAEFTVFKVTALSSVHLCK